MEVKNAVYLEFFSEYHVMFRYVFDGTSYRCFISAIAFESSILLTDMFCSRRITNLTEFLLACAMNLTGYINCSEQGKGC